MVVREIGSKEAHEDMTDMTRMLPGGVNGSWSVRTTSIKSS